MTNKEKVKLENDEAIKAYTDAFEKLYNQKIQINYKNGWFEIPSPFDSNLIRRIRYSELKSKTFNLKQQLKTKQDEKSNPY